MDLTLTEEQRQIAAAVDDLLASECGAAAMRHAAFELGGFDGALWRKLADLGACGIHIPEAYGGLGVGITEIVLVAEALGRRLACVPWLESAVLAGTTFLLVDSDEASARWLPGIVGGTSVATLDIGLVSAPRVWATSMSGGGWRLDGTLPAVPAASSATLLLLQAASWDGEMLVLVPLDAPRLQRRPVPAHDATRPLARVQLEQVEVPEANVLCRGRSAARALELTRQVANVALAAEQVGVAQQCLDLTVAYLAQRVQFGRPLASFQALKHRCAEMMVKVELARSAVLGAARGIDASPDKFRLLRLAAMARCQADEAAQFCTQEAIQLHGGVGYTWEYDPQLYFKRAQAARAWLGTPAHWRERAAGLWLDGKGT
ncbi:MAG: acyl-CoA dehydrogenase family protein [Proteobacteria bacterium]|nr:acyl-CoA dehydrogenase family protein [Pseudomonadota bacterium]HOL36580.1 acyl-CoA dehydrogenase family protein [Rubrivivax sp.]